MATAPDRPPLSPRHWPAWAGIGCLWLLAQLPMPLLRGIGRAVGALSHAFARRRRRYAERNVA
ncbi:MAG TPA: lipid A biosynthesis lauroyl acyltransferase, partial [Xanthomonadales bacterium]|nr:lipid A biosynthesis lauroyl acyltransferase [Xanthomonadales bacterium]